MATMVTCKKCGLSYQYDPKYHECRTEPIRKGETWLDEIKRKQGLDHWKEEGR